MGKRLYLAEFYYFADLKALLKRWGYYHRLSSTETRIELTGARVLLERGSNLLELEFY